jgi:hypothetical protein
LQLYCGEGKDPRFGVIDFAIGADVTEAFRAAVRTTAETEWKPLIRIFDGKPQQSDQEWAEVCCVPNWATEHVKEGGIAASGRTTGSWRSASRCASCRQAIKRNCRSRRRNLAGRGPINSSAS